jgi:hypothetical protein
MWDLMEYCITSDNNAIYKEHILLIVKVTKLPTSDAISGFAFGIFTYSLQLYSLKQEH